VIAEVGLTGFTQGPHLHFEYRVAGMPRDPQPLFHRSKRQLKRAIAKRNADANGPRAQAASIR
jgi:murein DD-endopeptidase MepM/ murein hydrolase activator NlpD